MIQNDESEYHLMSNSDTGFITYKSTLRAYDKHNASFTTPETKIHLMNINKKLKSPKKKKKEREQLEVEYETERQQTSTMKFWSINTNTDEQNLITCVEIFEQLAGFK